MLAEHGAVLIAARQVGLVALGESLTAAYAQIADNAEPAGFAYAPDVEVDATGLLARFHQNRSRDRAMRTTSSGPHRDDFDFMLKGKAAKDFASEGQQRALLLALRLAQGEWFRIKSGVRPVLLADDVLGELDPVRRGRFWAAVPAEAQVIATGTIVPDGDLGAWQIFKVNEGKFTG